MSGPVRDDNVLLKEVKGEEAFRLSDGSVINNLEQLYLRFKGMDQAVFTHHVNSQKNDFGNWIKDVYKDEKLANELFLATDKGSCAKAVARRILELKNKVNVGSKPNRPGKSDGPVKTNDSNKDSNKNTKTEINDDSFKTIPENVSIGLGFLERPFYEKKNTTVPALRSKQTLYKGETPAQILERILSQAAKAKIQEQTAEKMNVKEGRSSSSLKSTEVKDMIPDFLNFNPDFLNSDFSQTKKEEDCNKTYTRRQFGKRTESDNAEPLFHFDLQNFVSSGNNSSERGQAIGRGQAIEEIVAEAETKTPQHNRKQSDNKQSQAKQSQEAEVKQSGFDFTEEEGKAESSNEKEFELKEFEDMEGTEESNPSLRLREDENACHEMLKVVNSKTSPMQLFEELSSVFGRPKREAFSDGNNKTDKMQLVNEKVNEKTTAEKNESRTKEKNSSSPRKTAAKGSSSSASKKEKMLEHLKKVYG